MQRLGDELLAGARFPEDEHRRLGGRGLLHQLEDRLQLGRFPDHAAQAEALVHALAEARRVALELPLPHRLGDEEEERVHRDRLRQVVLGAGLHGLDSRFDVGERGHDDEDRVRPLLLRLLQEGQAVHPRHPQVGEDNPGSEVADDAERFLPVLGLADLVAFLGKEALESAPRVLLVVDQKDPFRSHGRISTAGLCGSS